MSLVTQEKNLPVATKKEDKKRKTSAVTQDQEKKKGKMSKSTQEEKKPVEESPNYIVVHVTTPQDGSEVLFKLQGTTLLKKLMMVYCDKKSMDIEQTVFLFEGRRIRGKQTPKELEMRDGDEIIAMPALSGGSLA
ncbi:PREDICTED: small ubiquitin-related modifier 1-like [Nicotiana attenuata]|uniref:small ubiquitin-related modifier 1-like n=1 Tax=Nicotiana attenuata TaxID=49451 RepID=UPI000904DBED|nr:PREDICTED: small ubiquitin-related modifier 1-like [Nicotiana attenuata]